MIKKCICEKEVCKKGFSSLSSGEKRSKVGEIYDCEEVKMEDSFGNRQIYYDVYCGDVFLFMLSEGEFKNNFQYLEEWRGQQLNEILDDSIKPFEPIKSMFERYGSIEGKRDIKIDKILK